MSEFRLTPLAGINTVAEDAAMVIGGDTPRVFSRDAVNINLSPDGRATLRPASRLATATRYKNLWQSPLHGDVFGTLNDDWVRISPLDWTCEILSEVGDGAAFHQVINHQVVVAAPAGLFVFDGLTAKRLTIPTPPAPLVVSDTGSLSAGTYGVAIAWLRGDTESATGAIAFVDVGDSGGMTVTFPPCLDSTVTGIRVYLTTHNGGALGRGEDYAINTTWVTIPLLPERGAAPQFQFLSVMPTGKYLSYWRGRLLTARFNLLCFSEAMAYHLHSERHGFIQLPQHITFVLPVDGGIWVGQVTHVIFLSGMQPDELTVQQKASAAPVPASGILVDADTIGADLAQSGGVVGVWLAENGYVAGTASGQLVELQARNLSGITGTAGTSVVLDKRILTVVI